MMKALIVLCHPERKSFNGALAELAKATLKAQGYTVRITDLYQEGFDPVESEKHFLHRENPDEFSVLGEQRHAFQTGRLSTDVERQIALLVEADFVLLQFPIWWHSVPAMMKGWIDRVFVSGGLYTSTKRYDRGHFSGKVAMCAATIGAPAIVMQPGGRGGTIEQILWSTQYSLHYMGFSVLPPFLADSVQGHGYTTDGAETNKFRLEGHKQSLIDRLRAIPTTNSIAYATWKDWDELGVAKRVSQ